jgi:hypothetical protein
MGMSSNPDNIRPHVVARWRALIPPPDTRHDHNADDRFAPPGEPPRTALGQICDTIRRRR